MIMRYLFHKLIYGDTITLCSIPIFLSFTLVVILLEVDRLGYTTTISEKIIVSIILFLWGIPGLIIILRRNYPLFGYIQGLHAIIFGSLFMLTGWGLALWMISTLLNH
jgi:hypothetical protein